MQFVHIYLVRIQDKTNQSRVQVKVCLGYCEEIGLEYKGKKTIKIFIETVTDMDNENFDEKFLSKALIGNYNLFSENHDSCVVLKSQIHEILKQL